MHSVSSYTISFRTIALLLRIDAAKERTLLEFSPKNLLSLRGSERLFMTRLLEKQAGAANLHSYSLWKMNGNFSCSTNLTMYVQSMQDLFMLKEAGFSSIKSKKTRRISPSNKAFSKKRTITKKNFHEFSEGKVLNSIKMNFFARVALLFYKRYN